ncbi:MAG: hypothetical protein KIH08_15295, partial [Candidatus Freyarchaeota archaeon]|nr:hypothetical protein [Candidatus Jordarchaeia archaeon]
LIFRNPKNPPLLKENNCTTPTMKVKANKYKNQNIANHRLIAHTFTNQTQYIFEEGFSVFGF